MQLRLAIQLSKQQAEEEDKIRWGERGREGEGGREGGREEEGRGEKWRGGEGRGGEGEV